VACATARRGDGLDGLVPLVLFGIAATTDFLDGRIARRAGVASGSGQVFDTVADVLFIETTFVCFAMWGRLSWLVPAAVAASVSAYAAASWRRARVARRLELARSRIGRAAGVLNYALVGVLAAEPAVSMPAWLIGPAALGVAGVNLLAVLGRIV
jgi:phosphatidylglycerophosphate synthase